MNTGDDLPGVATCISLDCTVPVLMSSWSARVDLPVMPSQCEGQQFFEIDLALRSVMRVQLVNTSQRTMVDMSNDGEVSNALCWHLQQIPKYEPIELANAWSQVKPVKSSIYVQAILSRIVVNTATRQLPSMANSSSLKISTLS